MCWGQSWDTVPKSWKVLESPGKSWKVLESQMTNSGALVPGSHVAHSQCNTFVVGVGAHLSMLGCLRISRNRMNSWTSGVQVLSRSPLGLPTWPNREVPVPCARPSVWPEATCSCRWAPQSHHTATTETFGQNHTETHRNIRQNIRQNVLQYVTDLHRCSCYIMRRCIGA